MELACYVFHRWIRTSRMSSYWIERHLLQALTRQIQRNTWMKKCSWKNLFLTVHVLFEVISLDQGHTSGYVPLGLLDACWCLSDNSRQLHSCMQAVRNNVCNESSKMRGQWTNLMKCLAENLIIHSKKSGISSLKICRSHKLRGILKDDGYALQSFDKKMFAQTPKGSKTATIYGDFSFKQKSIPHEHTHIYTEIFHEQGVEPIKRF